MRFYLKPVQKNVVYKLNRLLFQRDLSSDLPKFKQQLKTAKVVVVMTGAGISAESGIPTFRGHGGLWREFDITSLASPLAFKEDPGLVWEFYHYRRELVLRTKPNAGHMAIAQYEARHAADKKVYVLTQNVDGLHAKAGSKNVVELHGNLFKTRCTRCHEVLVNTDSPICEALRGRGSPTSKKLSSDIPEKDLPHCTKPYCGGLLRPHVVWFGERLDLALVDILDPIVSNCNVLLVVGTSSMVYPAAAFPIVIAAAGSIVAEFNVEPAPKSSMFEYYFTGLSATTLPKALSD